MSGILLKDLQYIYILDNDTGSIRVEKGPKRVNLSGFESQLGSQIKEAVIVHEDEYATLKNPYDEKTQKYEMGGYKIVEGPTVVFPQYKEEITTPTKVHVLSKNQALRLMAERDHDDKKAGEIWQIEGECKFIPNKDTNVLKTINAILIEDGQGIYVNNTETSQKKLVKGPRSYLLDACEELYYKQYSDLERDALGLPASPSFHATSIRLEKGQVVCILDSEKNEHVINGPRSYLLDADEHVKILWLSAKKPKVPKQIKAAIINLGPSFMSDKFEVRTRDNAHLTMLITYKWQFLVGSEETYKIFSMLDFIGYSCTSLCSRIREEAAKHSFEKLHSDTVGIIRNVLFSDHEVTFSDGTKDTYNGVYFPEIKLLISEVDIKQVTPVNSEINSLLNQSIKSNMIIVCNKMEQEANLNAEKEKIKASAQIQKLKESLIDVENENFKMEKIEKAKIEGQVQVLKATSKKEADELRELAKQSTEIQRIKSIISMLDTEEGKKYLELLRAQNFAEIKQQWYIPTDSTLTLPFNN